MPSQQPHLNPNAFPEQCPLCSSRLGPADGKPLYATIVCRTCRWSLAKRRIGAALIDCLWIWACAGVVESLFASARGLERNLIEFIVTLFFCLLVTLKVALWGISPGKYVFGLQTIHKASQLPIGPLKSFQRNIVLLVPFMALIAFDQMFRGPRAGDDWASTMVIRKKDRGRFWPATASRFCANCQYDLTGNVSGICPECGQAVPDPTRALLAEHR